MLSLDGVSAAAYLIIILSARAKNNMVFPRNAASRIFAKT